MIADETQPLPNSKAQRGKWRKWVVALLGVIVAGLVSVPMFLGVLIWDGSTHCAVTVVVLAQFTDTPVANAEVEILGSPEVRTREALGGNTPHWKEVMKEYDIDVMGETNDLGTVVLGARCGAGGKKNILGVRTGSYTLDHVLEVSHPKYEPLRIPLAVLLGQESFPLRRQNKLTVRVWLEPRRGKVASVSKARS